MKRPCMLLMLCLPFFVLHTASATTDEAAQSAPITQGYELQAAQAKELLEKAVAYYREAGDAALAELSRQGRFTTDTQYVYVVNTKGVMLASGGPSALFIGRTVSPLLEKDLQQAFAEALAQPESETIHSQEYRWMNWRDRKVERKHVFYQRIGDKVFAAGYYLPRSSAAEAQGLLDDAVSAMTKDAPGSINKINALDPFFNRDDLYVFVVDLRAKKIVAHGFNRRLINTDFGTLKAVDGQPIGAQMLSAAKGKQPAQVNYLWINPMTGAKEYKHTLLKSTGDYLIAVGYYSAEKP